MCAEELALGMYAVGGVALVFLFWKVSGKYKKSKQETNAKPDANHGDHPVSSE